MESSKEYLQFILGQWSELEEVTYRAMMGEFIIYYHAKIVGGIFRATKSLRTLRTYFVYTPKMLPPLEPLMRLSVVDLTSANSIE